MYQEFMIYSITYILYKVHKYYILYYDSFTR